MWSLSQSAVWKLYYDRRTYTYSSVITSKSSLFKGKGYPAKMSHYLPTLRSKLFSYLGFNEDKLNNREILISRVFSAHFCWKCPKSCEWAKCFDRSSTSTMSKTRGILKNPFYFLWCEMGPNKELFWIMGTWDSKIWFRCNILIVKRYKTKGLISFLLSFH